MAEVIYYFNSRSTGNWTDPDYMIDNILTNYAATASKGTVETLDGNTCPGDDLGAITAVEIRAYGYGDGDDKITLNGTALTMPGSAGWSSYVDTGITTWAGVVALVATVEFTPVAKGNTMRCAKVEIRVTYTPAGIDVTIDAPLVGVDSAGKGPSMSLGLSLSPPVVASSSQGLAPSLVRDKIFQAPVATIEGEGKIPSLSLGLGILPPTVSIDGEAKVPSFVRDMIFVSPLVLVDCGAKVPTPSLDVTLSPPIVALNSEALVASILAELVIFAPTVAIDSEALVPAILISGAVTIIVPVIVIDVTALVPSIGGGRVKKKHIFLLSPRPGKRMGFHPSLKL